jgi:hypothetical protein
MPVQDRTNAIQGEIVRLYRTFVYNGQLYDQMPDAPVVTLLQEDGSEMASLTATKERVGLYYVDWTVPVSLPPGKYYDRWTFKFTAAGDERQETSYWQVYTMDAFLSFTGGTSSWDVTDRMATLMNALTNDFIYEAQHIPLYWEQGLRTPDAAKFNFAYKNWLKDPKPLVRKNGMLMDDGWLADYDGNIFFEEAPKETDEIMAGYTFSYFSPEELASFIVEGLRAMNAIPPSSWYYNSVEQSPAYWDYGVLLVAAVHAMRRLVMGLNFQEKAIIFGEDPERSKSVQAQFQQLYQDYNSLWYDMAKDIKKALPPTQMIVVPEYTLPGGRARWFRYLFTTSSGG